MSLQAKTFLNLLAGAIAGLLAWGLTDGTGWFRSIFAPHVLVGPGTPNYGFYLLLGALFGLVLSLLLGVVESMWLDSRRQAGLLLVWSGLIGFVGGGFGLHVGQYVWAQIAGQDTKSAEGSLGLFLTEMFGRALGYSLIGCIVGASQGLSHRSVVIARQGAFGGLIGGFLGGVIYQILAYLTLNPSLSRLAALAATGALIGFFVGLVQTLFKQAWIRVILGRNEGKEYLIAKPITEIGRSELADIGLFGDPQIAPIHAVIESLPAQNRHRLRHVAGQSRTGETYAPTIVNGQPVTAEQWLADGDTLQIGRRTLQFHEKATRNNPLQPAAPRAEGTGTASPLSGASSYVGQELTETAVASRPSLTTPLEIVEQMGMAPETPLPLSGPAPPLLVTSPVSDATVMMTSPVYEDAHLGIGTRLVCTEGPYAGQSFALSHASQTLGRGTDRDLPFPVDTSVSRAHARIFYQNGRHFVADDGSSNGTFVNGLRLDAPRALRPGDLLQLGGTTLRYE